MIVDMRTYTMVPGRLGAWLALYEAEGMPIHVRHLGQPIGVFTTDVGTVNQVVLVVVQRSEAGHISRPRNSW
jgi:NIPSNAP